ncbi:hypothetical protein [Xanthomonas oryzae]|uniref:hypothetical protein n=1 Tax=Xanthomonas oryzae TaxID=347 RepID=UPI000A696A50|nr:hypothetical protein [Xanthomonas oryzae]
MPLLINGPDWKVPIQWRWFLWSANLTPIRNAVEDLLGEDFEGRFESKYLARRIVEPLLDPTSPRF